MYFSEALSSTSNELQQVSSGRSLNELQARSARSKRKEIELDESLLCASRPERSMRKKQLVKISIQVVSYDV